MGEADKAYERALTFLEKRDRTEREIADRLARDGFSEDAAMQTLGRLREAGLVDDADYAARYAEALTAKGRGRLRIAEEMRRKGLPGELVRNTLEDLNTAEDERGRALAEARKAFALVPEGTEPRKAMAKVSRRLAALGFSYDVIGEAVNRLKNLD